MNSTASKRRRLPAESDALRRARLWVKALRERGEYADSEGVTTWQRREKQKA
jgi:hypothetical protein